MKFIFKKLITIKEKMWQLYSYQIPAVFIFLLPGTQRQECHTYKQLSDEILHHIRNDKKSRK